MTTHIYRRYDPQTRSLTPIKPSSTGGTTEDSGSTVLHFEYTQKGYPDTRAPYIIFEVKNACGQNVWFSGETTPAFDGYSFAIPFAVVHAVRGNQLRYALAFASLDDDMEHAAFEQSAIDSLLIPHSRTDALLIRAGVPTDLPTNVGPDIWLNYFKENILVKPVEFNQSTGELTFRTYDGIASVIDIGTEGLTVPEETVVLDERDVEPTDVRPRPGTKMNDRTWFSMKRVSEGAPDFSIPVLSTIRKTYRTQTYTSLYDWSVFYGISVRPPSTTTVMQKRYYKSDNIDYQASNFGEALVILYADSDRCLFLCEGYGYLATKREDKGLDVSTFELGYTTSSSTSSGYRTYTYRSDNSLSCQNGHIVFRCTSPSRVYCEFDASEECYYPDPDGDYGVFDNINTAGRGPIYISDSYSNMPRVVFSTYRTSGGQQFMFDDCYRNISFSNVRGSTTQNCCARPIVGDVSSKPSGVQYTEYVNEYGSLVQYTSGNDYTAYWMPDNSYYDYQKIQVTKMILPYEARYVNLPPDPPEGS